METLQNQRIEKNKTRIRISGVVLPQKKKIEIALTSIYGIGKATATKILQDTDVSPETKCYLLTPSQAALLRKSVAEFATEGVLRREKELHEERLRSNGSVRGRRSNLGLPRRGQRTRTNAKTARRLKK